MSAARRLRALWRRLSRRLRLPPVPTGEFPDVRLPAGTVLRIRSDMIVDQRDLCGDEAWLDV